MPENGTWNCSAGITIGPLVTKNLPSTPTQPSTPSWEQFIKRRDEKRRRGERRREEKREKRSSTQHTCIDFCLFVRVVLFFTVFAVAVSLACTVNQPRYSHSINRRLCGWCPLLARPCVRLDTTKEL